MAAVVSALDTHGLQCGENGHVEHTWSESEKEKILQLSFQLTRTSDSNRIKQLGEMYRNMVINSIDENGSCEPSKSLKERGWRPHRFDEVLKYYS